LSAVTFIATPVASAGTVQLPFDPVTRTVYVSAGPSWRCPGVDGVRGGPHVEEAARRDRDERRVVGTGRSVGAGAHNDPGGRHGNVDPGAEPHEAADAERDGGLV
jgi:hypothetical protein